MKKLILLLVLAAGLFQCGFAQEKSVAGILCGENLEDRIRMDFEYAISVKKTHKGSGTLVLQDKCFKFTSGPVSIYNNGDTVWTVDASLKEVVIQRGFPLASDMRDEDIIRTFGIEPERDSVIPRLSQDGKLTGLSCRLKNGAGIDVRITASEKRPRASLSDFTFDESHLDQSWVITDLR